MTGQPDDDLRQMHAIFDADHDRLRDQLMASLPEQAPRPGTVGRIHRGWQWVRQTKTRRVLAGSVAAAVPLAIGGLIVLAVLFPSRSGSVVALADVLQTFERDLSQNDYVHLVVTGNEPRHDDPNRRYIWERKFWEQRPSRCRMEIRLWTIFEKGWLGSLVPDAVFQQVWNGDRLYVWDPDERRWGLLEEAEFLRKHRVTYHEYRNRTTELCLQAKWYAKPDWPRGTFRSATGRVIGREDIQGQPATIYEFREYEKRVCKCWLRDTDKRLLKMEVYRTGESLPYKTVEIRAYGGSPPDGIFDPTPSHKLDYSKKRQLGCEHRPQVIDPNVVALKQGDSAARFYRLNARPGRTRDQVIAEAVRRGQPAVEVTIEQGGPFEIKVRPSGDLDHHEPAAYRTLDIGPFTEPMYGVLRAKEDPPEGPRLRFIPRSKHDGQGRVLVVFTYYKAFNVASYAKVALDADGDGDMDAWCQIPSDQVIEDWLKSGCGWAKPRRRK